jgi:hypothetical protein
MTGPPEHQAEEREIAASAASPEWNRAEMERAPEANPPVRRERVFSPKVLIGWALFTLVMYFGIHFVGTVVKETVRQAVVSSRRASTPGPKGDVVIVLPNGKRITIHTDNRRGPTVSVTETPPAGKAPVTATPPTGKGPATEVPPGAKAPPRPTR